MSNKLLDQPLIERLRQADICCHECGQKYGKYSVGCSSTWIDECPICGKEGRCTETRDYGYLQKGITELEEPASYEVGEITLKLTEEEVGFLNVCLDVIADNHEGLCAGHSKDNPEDVKLFESIEKKITDLYDDYCVKFELAPALKAYIAKYGDLPGPEDNAKWEVFRDTYNWLMGEGAEK
jgi:hypothetical protein